MRSAAVAVLVLFAACAFAQEEGEAPRPGVRIPEERSYEDLGASLLQLVPEVHRADAQRKIAELNQERAKLREKLQEARAKLLVAQKDLNQVLADLDQQDVALVDYLSNKLGEEGKVVALRLRLQPVIEWLDLSETQARDLLEKQKPLVELVDLRAEIAKQARAAVASGVPKSKEEREAQIALLKKYDEMSKQWIDNIRATVQNDPEKLRKFNLRYRRTRHAIGGM